MGRLLCTGNTSLRATSAYPWIATGQAFGPSSGNRMCLRNSGSPKMMNSTTGSMIEIFVHQTTCDFVSIILDRALQKQSRHALPLLVDMDIHYRIFKMMYGATYSAYDVRSLLGETPLLYGIYTEYNSEQRK